MSDNEVRYTFSSLMTSLIGRERKLKELYERSAERTSRPELRSLLFRYGENSSKRMYMMQRARIETVVEITLEPLTCLDVPELLGEIDGTIDKGHASDLEKIIALERTLSELYAKVSRKTMKISADTGQLLAILSHESSEREDEMRRVCAGLWSSETKDDGYNGARSRAEETRR